MNEPKVYVQKYPLRLTLFGNVCRLSSRRYRNFSFIRVLLPVAGVITMLDWLENSVLSWLTSDTTASDSTEHQAPSTPLRRVNEATEENKNQQTGDVKKISSCHLAVFWSCSPRKVKKDDSDEESGNADEGKDGNGDVVAVVLERAILLSPLTILSLAILAYFLVYLRACKNENQYVMIVVDLYTDVHIFVVVVFTVYTFFLAFMTREKVYKQLSECDYLQYGMFASLVSSLLIVLGSIVVSGPTGALVAMALGLGVELFSMIYSCVPKLKPYLPDEIVYFEIGINLLKCGLYACVAQNVWNFQQNHSRLPGICAAGAVISSLARCFSVCFKCTLLIAFSTFGAAALLSAFVFTNVICTTRGSLTP